MKRRTFLKGGLAASSFVAVSGLSYGKNLIYPVNSEMKYNTLGRTGVSVSRLGYGCAPLGWSTLTQDDVNELVLKAVDLGINYFDTAPNYREAEERMGEVVPSIREKIFLVSKTEAHDYDGTWRLLEQSLKRMKTDTIDLIHIHNLGLRRRFEDINYVLSEKGSLGALQKAKEQGIIRFIGASGHVYPTRFHKAIDNEEIDVLMNAVNYIIRHVYNFEEKIWYRAMEKDMGLVAMKVFGGAVKRTDSRMNKDQHEMALRYAYSLPGLSTAVIGMKNMDELIENVNAVNTIQPLSDEEMHKLSQEGLSLARNETWKQVHGRPVI